MVRSLTLRRKKTRRHARTKKLNKRKRFTKKVKSTRRRRVRRTLTRRKQKGGNEDEDIKVVYDLATGDEDLEHVNDNAETEVEVEKPNVRWSKAYDNEIPNSYTWNGITIVLNEEEVEADKAAAALVDADELKRLIGEMDKLGEEVDSLKKERDEQYNELFSKNYSGNYSEEKIQRIIKNKEDREKEIEQRYDGPEGIITTLNKEIQEIYNTHPAAFRNEFRDIVKRQPEQLKKYDEQLKKKEEIQREQMRLEKNQKHKTHYEQITSPMTRNLYDKYKEKRDIVINKEKTKFWKNPGKDYIKAREKLQEALYAENLDRVNKAIEEKNNTQIEVSDNDDSGDSHMTYPTQMNKLPPNYNENNFKSLNDKSLLNSEIRPFCNFAAYDRSGRIELKIDTESEKHPREYY